MRPKTIALLLLSLFPLAVQAQSALAVKGVVVEQNSQVRMGQIKYLAGVTVRLGEKTTTSDANGQFSIGLDAAPYGKVVWVQADKSGYDLINQEELKMVAVADGAEPVWVVMAPKDQPMADQSAYAAAAQEAWQALYQRKIAVLSKAGLERDQLVSEMKADFNREFRDANDARAMLEAQKGLAKDKAKAFAEAMVTVNLDQQSAAYQAAIRTLKEKKDLEGSMALLEPQELASRLRKAAALDQDPAKPNDSIQRDAQQLIFLARLQKLAGQFPQADSSYAIAVRSDRMNLPLWEEYVAFLREQSEVGRAIGLYQDAVRQFGQLAAADQEGYLPYLAWAHHSLGGLHFVLGKLDKALDPLKEALSIRRDLAAQNPYTFGVQASNTAIVLAILENQQLAMTGDDHHYQNGMNYLQYAWDQLSVYKEITPEITILMRAIDGLRTRFQQFDPTTAQMKQTLLELEEAVKTEKDPLKKVELQSGLIQMQEKLAKESEPDAQIMAAIGNEYGSLAWFQLFARDFASAEASARKGMELAPKEDWIVTNLALALLYQGKWPEAEKIYLRLKDQPYRGGTYGKAFLSDLDELKAAGIHHPDAAKAKKLLE